MYRTACFPSSFLFSPFFLPLSPFPLSLSLSLFPCTTVSKVYNRVLALDEVVQFTEEDEWAYHEMAANVPLFSHPNPRSVSAWCSCNHIGAVTACCVVAQLFPLLSSSSFFILLWSLIFSLSPSPSPHSLSGALTPLSFLSPPLPPYLLTSSIPPHLTRCWW